MRGVQAAGRGRVVEPEQAIYQRLADDETLTGLVAGRIYPDEADEDSPRPLIVYAIVGTQEYRDLAGTVGKSRHDLDVMILADSFPVLKAITSAVNTSLDRQQFDGVDRVYRTDYLTQETEDGYEAILSYNVWQ